MANAIESVLTIGKSPADTMAVVIGADSNNTAGTAIGAMNIANSLASTVKNIPGINNSLAAASLANNLYEANLDLKNPDTNYKIDDSTAMALNADALAIAAIAATLMNSKTAALALVSATAVSLWSAFQESNSTEVSDYWLSVLDTIVDMKNDFSADVSDWIDSLLNPTSQTEALPGLDDFVYYDPDLDDNNSNDDNSNDDNTNAPDSGNNNDDDNAPEPIKPPPPKDPLILDTDKDGFISTIALQDSNAYFDITGDGIKERVSWIAPNDGILVYDKNESGKIDGIDEVFGNFTKNGFEELKELIDSNHDGKIDRQDELFNRLQIWNDLNGDGTTQTNELSSLKDTGVKSIDLNYVNTNINLGGATLTQASKYTDTQNNKELVADVNLEYNPILTTVDTSTIPDYSVDPDTLFLPQLRGYGLIMDSLISYNTNDALKEKALELQAGGIQAIAEGFEEFSDMWSGYTELIDSMKEKYNVVGDVNLAEIDKRVWILERLTNSPTQTPAIEARLEATLKQHANETLSEALITQSVIPSVQIDYYNAYYQRDFINRYEGAFALQSAFELEGAHYSKDKSKFIVDDRTLLFQEAAEYFNSNEHSLQEKTYLAQLLNMQIGRYMNYSYEYEIVTVESFGSNGKAGSISYEIHVTSEHLESGFSIHSSNYPSNDKVVHSLIQTYLRQKDMQSLLESLEDSPEKQYIQTALTLDTSKFHVFDEDMIFNGDGNFILGNQTDDFITSTGNNATILADTGDDIISTGSGADTILYRKV